jgi:ADP-ribosylglycohydrolase
MSDYQLQNMFLWIAYNELNVEQAQLQDEGKQVSSAIRAEFASLLDLDHDELFAPANQRRAGKLLDKTAALRVKKGFPFDEPSELELIRALRPAGSQAFRREQLDQSIVDRIHGAWLGRCIGCFLGKAAEGLRTDYFWPFLKDTGQWPLNDYIRYGVSGKLGKKYADILLRGWSDELDHMPVDDDTNYTTAGLLMLKGHGFDFTPTDVAQFWLEYIPILATFTAERVAYRNFALHVQPPQSASYRNPYREWIGAQIRADIYGYVNAGNPERAADLAWRDACISHVKNGIYGAMFMAAVIAAAPYCKDIPELMEAGLCQIPVNCRLAAHVNEAVEWYRQSITYDEAIGRIHARWNEYDFHHWCHVIPNAVICAVALLWGENDFGASICKAVQAGFDTDCNGATVGSIMGMRLGTAGIESRWSARLKDTLHTSLAGYNVVKISRMAEETWELIQFAD